MIYTSHEVLIIPIKDAKILADILKTYVQHGQKKRMENLSKHAKKNNIPDPKQAVDEFINKTSDAIIYYKNTTH